MTQAWPRRENQAYWKKAIELIKSQPEAKAKEHLYASARGYDSWPYVNAHLLLLCAALARICFDRSLPISSDISLSAEAGSAALVAISNDAPLRHLGADLARAFLATKPLPCDGEHQMPYPIFLLNLPKEVLFDDTGAGINTIIVCSYDYWVTKCLEKGLKVVKVDTPMDNGGLQITGLANDGTQLVRTVSWTSAHETNLESKTLCVGPFNETLVSNAVDRMMRIVLNSMSAMTWRKDLLEIEQVSLRGGFSARKQVQSERPIYWIGKNYAFKRSVSHSSKVTGQAKAPHWRCGHWHTVKHGAKRQESKLLWFEPVYVNASLNP